MSDVIAAHPPLSPGKRLALDLGPLLLFFAAYEMAGIYIATGVFMVAIMVALGLGYWLERRLGAMPLFTAFLVLVFGGLTIYLKNDTFIKMKPTVLYALFGFTLIGGLKFNRLFIKYIFTQAFDLTEEGWRKLTWRWGLFFLFLAVVNEIVWRSFSTEVWVNFKVWAVLPIFVVFALAQTPLVQKYELRRDEN
jgi:intracellular septation protein